MPASSNDVKETLAWLKKALFDSGKDRLEHHDVVGFQAFEANGYQSRQPVYLRRLISEKLERNFHVSLQAALDELKNEQAKKSTLHSSLLKKYLNIDLYEEAPWETSLEPNAFKSLPKGSEADCMLHLHFLQPFRLFNILADNRKHIGKGNKANREWLWFPHSDSDVGPLFRAAIQLYILNYILEDYKVEENEYHSDDVFKNVEHLKALQNNLKLEIENKLKDVFKVARFEENDSPNIPDVPNVPPINGDRRGIFLHGSPLRDVSADFLYTISYYPIGRLMYGQSPIPSHDIFAEVVARDENRPLVRKLEYVWGWFLAHLNISTSLYWSRLFIEMIVDAFADIKNYIINPGAHREDFIARGIWFSIKNALLLPVLPILVVFSWVYGITSIPFSLLRTLCIYGPFDRLRDFKVLKALDCVELIKDGVVFGGIMGLVLWPFMEISASLIPTALLTLGTVTSFSILVFACIFILKGHPHLGSDLLSIARLPFYQIFGLSLTLSMGIYLGMGLMGRRVYPHLPSLPPLPAKINKILAKIFKRHSLLDKKKMEKEFALQCENIIPVELQEPLTSIPKVSLVRLSEREEMSRDNLVKQLGQLNQSFNLNDQQKKKIRDCIEALTIKEDSTTADIHAAIIQGTKMVNGTLQRSHFVEIRALIEKLPEPKQFQRDQQALRVAEQRNGFYLPSMTLLKELERQHMLESANNTLSSEVRNKFCAQL